MAPRQIVFASGNKVMCALLHTAAYLEHTLQPSVAHGRTFIFGDGRLMDTRARAIISRAIDLGEFVTTAEGSLGTHSIRKGASTLCARNGASKDEIMNRGRWRHSTIVDRYISVTLPVPDAKMSVLLTGPRGAITYKVKEEFLETVTEDWIRSTVTPSITAVMGPNLGLVFGRALLWATVGFPKRMPIWLRHLFLTH